MKNIKEYLLLALALILGAIALVKLTKDDILYIPVNQTTLSKSEVVYAVPVKEEGDVKEKDPLGIMGTTLTFDIPEGMELTEVRFHGKRYKPDGNTIYVPFKVDKKVKVRLREVHHYCWVPKEAVVHYASSDYILTKSGLKPIAVTGRYRSRIYFPPPCPKTAAIGKDLRKRVEALLHR